MRRRRLPITLNPFTKRTIRIGWPVVLSQAAAMLLANIDMAMVGRLSTDALAAVGVAGTYMNLMVIIANATAFGFAVHIAMELGRPKGGQAGTLTYHGLITGVFAGFFVMACAWVTAGPVFRGMGLEDHVLTMAMDYGHYFSLSFLAMALCGMISAALSAYTHTKHIFISSLIVLVVNTVGDYALIFGHFGMPAMGVRGAALASVLSVWVQGVYLLAVVWFYRKMIGPRPSVHPRDLYRTIRRVAPNSISAMLEWMIWFGGVFILTVMIAPLGAAYLAVFHVNLKLQQLFLLGMMATTTTSRAMIGRAFGSGHQPNRITQWHRHAMTMGWWVILPWMILIAAIPVPMFAVFMDPDDVRSVGSPYILGGLIAITIVVRYLNTTVGTTLRSMGVVHYFIYSTTASQVFMLSLAYLLMRVFDLGLWGAMLASFADETLRVLVNGYVVKRYMKAHVAEVAERRAQRQTTSTA